MLIGDLTAEERLRAKEQFADSLCALIGTLREYVCTEDGQWAVKGFIDTYRNVYSISSDTKITSKILEIHIFPELVAFAARNGFELVLTEHQNHYPDMSFVSLLQPHIKFAVDLKTTYRRRDQPHRCNWFTLGSHGEYFRNRTSTKNIRFPYSSYLGHFCLGVIYDRAIGATIDETIVTGVDDIASITSVMSNMQFFLAEKWRLASDRRGSGNTANIGSIDLIEDVLVGGGMFSLLGEEWFDEYWMNYGLILVPDGKGGSSKITKLTDFVAYKGGDAALINARRSKALK
jgi:Restriction endonuclease EcoRV